MSTVNQETQPDKSSKIAGMSSSSTEAMPPTSEEAGLHAMQKGLTAAMAPLQSVCKANVEIGAECTNFWAHRMQAHADYWKKFAQCKDLGDLAKIQTSFFQSMTRDYSDETANLINVTGSQVQSTVEMFNHSLDGTTPREGRHLHH
jgi:Phasin protein